MFPPPPLTDPDAPISGILYLIRAVLRGSAAVALGVERSERRVPPQRATARAAVSFNWGRVAVRHDPVSKAKYEALRARGHCHARAIRSVVDRLLYVACTMLENRTLFDPSFGEPKSATA